MWKRILGLLLASVFIMIFMTGCGANKLKSEKRDGDSMFISIESIDLSNVSWNVVYHKDTKVMYMITSRGPMLLVNADGSPMLYNP